MSWNRGELKMSHEGQMFRGEKWNRHLLEGSKISEDKQADVDYYLENKAPEPVVKEEKPKSKGK
jgi:hypothetical protein